MHAQVLVKTAGAAIADFVLSMTPRIPIRLDSRYALALKCRIFGHDDWMRRAPGRLYLKCLECGRETPGWTIGGGTPARQTWKRGSTYLQTRESIYGCAPIFKRRLDPGFSRQPGVRR